VEVCTWHPSGTHPTHFLSNDPQEIAGCDFFPVDNIWNVPIDDLSVDSNSAAYIATIGADTVLHPSFHPS